MHICTLRYRLVLFVFELPFIYDVYYFYPQNKKIHWLHTFSFSFNADNRDFT